MDIRSWACALFLLAAREGRWAQAVLTVVVAAGLPWLHSKFLILAITGLAMTLWRVRRLPFAVLSVAFFIASMAELLSLFHRFYGTASFSAPIYGNTPPALFAGPIPFLIGVFTRGTTGLFFDRVFGLFVFAPVWFLSVPAFASLVRRDRGTALRVLLLVVSIVGVTAGFSFWSGGLSVPARYCLPFVPALAVALAAALPERRTAAAAMGSLQVGILLLGLGAVDAIFPTIGVARAMVTVYDDDNQLATLPIDQQTTRTATTISLPVGAQRLRASGQGLEGAARVTDVHLIPEAVVPVSQRGPV